jgi:L-amino acid N-acyltransferase YncA
MSTIAIRPASPADAAGCARVYAPYVTDSCISFEYEPPTAEDFAARMASAHAWMVAPWASRRSASTGGSDGRPGAGTTCAGGSFT